MPIRKYFAERAGKPRQLDIDLDTLREAFCHTVRSFMERYYFQEATGYECVDAGRTLGTWGDNPRIYIMSETGLDDVWPIKDHASDFDKLDLFTMIEFLHDHVSKPEKGFNHKWNNCGWHYSTFNREEGQKEFSNAMNQFLPFFQKGYELRHNGEIWRKISEGLQPLLDSTPKTNNPEAIDHRVEDAKSKFLRHNACLTDKKDAVRTLGDVLERIRPQITAFGAMSKSDESDLFKIINGFDIRHHNRDQQGEYNREIFYDWMFYTFLSSIDLILRYAEETNQSVV